MPLLLYFQEKLDAQKRRDLGDDSQLKDIQGQEGQHSTQPGEPERVAAADEHAGYGPGSGDKEMRWDLWYLPGTPRNFDHRMGGVTLRRKAQWYKDLFDRRIAA